MKASPARRTQSEHRGTSRYSPPMDIWDMIAQERLELATLFEGLSAEQWETQSLCGAWTVRDIAAHLLMPLVTSGPKFMLTMARCGGNFNQASQRLTASVGQRSNSELIAGLRHDAASHFTPPGLGAQAPLTDSIVHGQDVRRPLGIQRTIPEEQQRLVLDFLVSSKAQRGFVAKGRLDSLEFQATDLDWASGTGARVDGPSEALMMAIAGRPVATADLNGPGVAAMSRRIETK